MADWQPIETAPRDGTNILLWDDRDGTVCAAAWNPSRKAWVASGTEDNLFWVELTHWRQSPEPPTCAK